MSAPLTYTAKHEARLRQAWMEYGSLASLPEPPFTLNEIFDLPDRSIDDYCRDFTANPHGPEARRRAREWAQSFEIWCPGLSEHVVDMGTYLYPTSGVSQLAATAKLFLVDWFLNDTIGRDKVSSLHVSAQRAAVDVTEKMIATSRDLAVRAAATRLERACANVLEELRESSSPRWFAYLTAEWVDHLRTMGDDGNARSRGQLWGMSEYEDYRIRLSGMRYTIALADYASERQLGWPILRDCDLSSQLRDVWWLTGAIGGLSNDLFSLEKEFIIERGDANLVPVVLLHNPEVTLGEAVQLGIGRVNGYMSRFVKGVAQLRVYCVDNVDPPFCEQIFSFLDSLEGIVKASWLWQSHSWRYKFPASIFAELRLG